MGEGEGKRKKRNRNARKAKRDGVEGARQGIEPTNGEPDWEAVELEEELRRVEDKARKIKEQIDLRRREVVRTRPRHATRHPERRNDGVTEETESHVFERPRSSNPRMQAPPQDYAPSVLSSKPEKGRKRKTQIPPANPAFNTRNGRTASTPNYSSSREGPFSMRGGARKLAEDTTGHWGDLDDSDGDTAGPIDWKARAAVRNSLEGLSFPKGWEIPPPHVVKKFFRQIDFNKELKRGTLKPFLGTLGDFPRFKSMFYENVHVQDASVLSKCEALDSLIPDQLIDKMFFGLGVSGVDYVTRLERLIRRFDREDVYRDNLLRQLDKLQSSRGENEEILERSVYAIKSFMDNSTHHERSSRWLLDMLEDHLPESMLRQYNFDLRMNHYKHTAARLTQWLELYLESLMDTRQMKRMVGERKGKFKPSWDAPKDRAQMACEKGEEQEEGKQMTTLSGAGGNGELCEYCHKDHDIYHCARFFALTAAGRRQALDKYQGCYLCLKKGHFINDCVSKLKCRFCGGKHNSSVHLTPAPEPTTQEGANFSGEEGSQKRTGMAQEEGSIPRLPMEKVSGLTGGKREKKQVFEKENAGKGSPKTDGEIAAEKLAENEQWRKEKEELKQLLMAENSLATLAVTLGPNRIKVNALLDSGADNASLYTTVADLCGFQPLETQTYSVKVGGGRVNTYTDVGMGFMMVNKPDLTYQARCVVRVYPTPVGDLRPVDWSVKKEEFPHLKDLPIEPTDPNAPVGLLIGTRNPQLFEMLDVRRGGPGEPWAYLSPPRMGGYRAGTHAKT